MSLRAVRLLENVSDVVWLLDLDDFRFLFVSPSVVRLRGYSVEEVLAADGADALTPGSAAHLQRVLPERVAAFRAGVEATYVDELEHPCKGGGTVWAETSMRCGVDEATGHLLVYGTSRDITDRRRAEEERAAREALQEQLASVMVSVPGAVYTFRMNADGSACMPFAAVQVEDLFGLPRARLAADMAPVFERIHADDVGQVRAGIAAAGGAAWHDEFRYHHPSSGLRWIEGWSRPRPLPGGGVEWHGFAMDVTDRKRTEEARRKSEARALELSRALQLKDEFLAMMSHELRTPLNAVLGLTDLMRSGVYGPLTAQQESALAQVGKSSHHLLAMLTNILDLAQIDAGTADLKRQWLEVQDLVQWVLHAIEAAAQAKRLQLWLHVEHGSARLVGDERRLRQILLNLVDNAVKFTPEGGTVRVEVTADREREAIRFAVRDTGIGIAPEDQGRLLQPFTQVDGRLSRGYGGIGLGLTLVRRLVELHHGSVQLESEPGAGSCFTVTLPWHHGGDVPGEPDVAPRIPSAPWETPPRVLVVDDHEITRAVYTDMLGLMGCAVSAASTGEEALERVHAARPEVVLMDIQMPGMDGLAAIRRLRAEPEHASLPILALTALVMPGDRERCLAAGATRYLAKPVALRELVATIGEVLAAPAAG